MRTAASLLSALLAVMLFATCDEPEGRLTGTWQGRRFDTDVWKLTINDSHGRLTGDYLISWGEDPPQVSGSLSGSTVDAPDKFGVDVLIDFSVQIAAGTAKCRYRATFRDEAVLSGETVCERDGREFQVGHLGMRRE